MTNQSMTNGADLQSQRSHARLRELQLKIDKEIQDNITRREWPPLEDKESSKANYLRDIQQKIDQETKLIAERAPVAPSSEQKSDAVSTLSDASLTTLQSFLHTPQAPSVEQMAGLFSDLFKLDGVRAQEIWREIGRMNAWLKD